MPARPKKPASLKKRSANAIKHMPVVKELMAYVGMQLDENHKENIIKVIERIYDKAMNGDLQAARLIIECLSDRFQITDPTVYGPAKTPPIHWISAQDAEYKEIPVDK